MKMTGKASLDMLQVRFKEPLPHRTSATPLPFGLIFYRQQTAVQFVQCLT